MIITGDMTQIDLPRGQRSGLNRSVTNTERRGRHRFPWNLITKGHSTTLKLVIRIVNAYESHDDKEKENKEKD